jgi:hypothetical protein
MIQQVLQMRLIDNIDASLDTSSELSTRSNLY